MARRLFFVEAIRRGAAELRGEDARHLTKVLRVERGQRYEISDNQSVYLAEVETAHKEEVFFRVLEKLPPRPESPPVVLYASLVKFDRFEWIVEKATELGVTEVVPIEAARTERGLYDAARKRVARWRKIGLESSQQSRRAVMPKIGDPVRFQDILEIEATQRLFLDEERGGRPLLASLPAASVALLVGPEGGWTEGERKAAAGAGWTSVTLGPRILRAETAALAALAVVMAANDEVAPKEEPAYPLAHRQASSQ